MSPLRGSVRRVAAVVAGVVAVAAVASATWLALRPGSTTCAGSEGALTFHSDTCQDRWIVHEVFPDLHKGFFVDVGSADGVVNSNSKVLEDLGWEGICVDPFPANMSGRRCAVFAYAVDSTGGKRVRFRKAGGLGGIEEHLGSWKSDIQGYPVVEVETRTLTEILSQAGAPPFIHYMSIDIEGAELEALKGLDLSRYRIGALTIEHNFEEPKRSDIRKLLERYGYRRVRSVEQDDYYLGRTEGG